MGSQVAHRLTEKQATFVSAVVDGMPITAALERAGYSCPKTAKRYLLAQPHITAAIEQGMRARLRGEIAPEAWRVILEIMRDTKVAPRTRLDAGKFIAQTAGYVPPKPESHDTPDEKDPSEMTTEELRAHLDKIEEQLGQRATRVAPGSAPIDTQLSDMLG